MMYNDDYTAEYFAFEESLSKRFFKPVSSKVKDYAIGFVLGDNVSVSLKEELYSYIDNRFEKLGTCILWNKAEELIKILTKYGVKIGSKEAIIKRDAVLTSKNQKVAPKVTFSI